jgi:hypothetical protein
MQCFLLPCLGFSDPLVTFVILFPLPFSLSVLMLFFLRSFLDLEQIWYLANTNVIMKRFIGKPCDLLSMFCTAALGPKNKDWCTENM